MKQESLNKATELVIDAIQNSDINIVDKVELLMNISTFLENYHEAIKQRFDKPKSLRRTNDVKRSSGTTKKIRQ